MFSSSLPHVFRTTWRDRDYFQVFRKLNQTSRIRTRYLQIGSVVMGQWRRRLDGLSRLTEVVENDYFLAGG